MTNVATIASIVRRTTTAQHLPERVDDPAACDRIARLFEPGTASALPPSPRGHGLSNGRPPRRMPPLNAIAAYWRLSSPLCTRCGWHPPCSTWREAGAWLDRAHIIDRWAGGLDLASNLLPLCQPCHRDQPTFKPGDEAEALKWLTDGKHPRARGTKFVLFR